MDSMTDASRSIDRNEREYDAQPEELRVSELLLRADHRISFEMILRDEDLDTDAIRKAEERIRRNEVSEQMPDMDGFAYTPENHAQSLREQMTAWAFHCGAKSNLWREAGGDSELLIRLMECGVSCKDPVPVTVDGWRRYYSYCPDAANVERSALLHIEPVVHYSERDLGLARLLYRHYLWNYSGESKGRGRIEVNQIADTLAPGLAARFPVLDGERLGDIERHTLSIVLVAERPLIREQGAVPVNATQFILRMLADKLLPRLEWDERSHGMASRGEIYRRLHGACRPDVDRPIAAGIRASVCAERLIESNRLLLNQMADEAVQATESAPAA